MTTNAVIPFDVMERMAVTVAKSGLFGMRTPEQALTLMLLAQAEGIPAMIAVRDYHIMNGKPTMKADTMLARFQESGGVVEWHAYDDERCEATFTHPKSPKPVRIDWDIARARRAGLADKEVWKAYGRAMLRSRVISEGVKTCYPACIAGKYTPEEIQSIDPDVIDVTPDLQRERVQAAIAETAAQADPGMRAQRQMLQETTEGYITAIRNAATSETLRRCYGEAYTAARQVGDTERMKAFVTAYEERKAELQATP